MMRHTLGTAAKACGVGRTTILRAIKSGRLSAQKDDTGVYAIDPSELHRVFPPVQQKQSAEHSSERYATGVETDETAVFKAKIEGLEARLKIEHETVDDLRRRLDFADEERRRLTMLLTHQPTAPDQDNVPINQNSANPIKTPLREKFREGVVSVFGWIFGVILLLSIVLPIVFFLKKAGILPPNP